MSVRSLLDKVETSDEHLEANLYTMLQSVRGTKQYWFLRQSELKCMIWEWGSPTLFLTFSCAEYESPDIANFLRSVNNVSSSYDIGKLWTEDPISVFIKFSKKFHAFFNTVLMKGGVLSKADHFYWKKGGAPHYHVLLWVRDPPVISQDDPDKVLSWIQERITCQIPDKKPVLNYTGWLPGTKCTNAAHTAKGNASALLALLLPDAGLDFLAKHVRGPSLIL